MNITILGHVCIDNNVSEGISYTDAGSPAMFMSRIYKKFPQTNISIIAPYGKDFSPYAQGILLYPISPLYDKTLIYENKSQGNIRTQKALNREYAQPVEITEEIIKVIASSDIIFLAPLTPDYSPEYVSKLLSYAKDDALKVLLPQGYYRNFDVDNNVLQRDFVESTSLLPLFDVVIVSEQDHKQMSEYVKEWSQNVKVIMTLGDKGSSYYYKEDSVVVSVEAVTVKDIVDSVGSGDIFSASFAYKYHLTKDPNKSLAFANNIARQCLFWPASNLQFTLPK